MAVRFTGEMTPRGDYIFEDERGMRMPLRPERARQVAAYTGIDLGVGAPPVRGGPDLRLASNQPPGPPPKNAATDQELQQAMQGAVNPNNVTVEASEFGKVPSAPEDYSPDDRAVFQNFALNETSLKSGVGTKEGQTVGTVKPKPPEDPNPKGFKDLRTVVAPPQYQHIPGQPDRTWQSTTRRQGPSPDVLKRTEGMLNATMGGQIKALHSQADAERAKYEAQSEHFKSEAARLHQERILNETPLYRAREEQERFQRILNEEIEAVRDTEIDPGGRMDTANTALAAISVALGEIGRGMTGGGNNIALDIINRKIDRDVKAQMVDLQNRREALGDREREMLRAAGDVKHYENVKKILEREKYATELERLQADTNLQSLAAQTQAMVADLRRANAQDIAALTTSVKELTEQHSVSRQAATPGQTVQVGGGLPEEQVYGTLGEVPERLRPKAVQLPSGKVAIAVTEQEAKDLRKATANYRTALDWLGKLKTLNKEGGVLTTEKEAEAKRFINNYIATRSVATGQGAMSDDERKVAAENLYNRWMEDTALSALGAEQDVLSTQYINNVQSATFGNAQYAVLQPNRKQGSVMQPRSQQ